MNKPPRGPTQIQLEKKCSEDSTVNRQVQEYIQGVVAAYGGWSEVTSAELAMLSNQKFILCTILSLQKKLSGEAGDLMADKDKAQILWAVIRFQSEFRQGMVALGLARPRITSRRPANLVGQPKDSIAAILEEYGEKKKADKKLKVV